MDGVRTALPAGPAALIVIGLALALGPCAGVAAADEGEADAYGELPVGTVVVQPGQTPVRIRSPRWLVDESQLRGAVACARTNERLRKSLLERARIAERLSESDPPWELVVKGFVVGMAVVGSFALGAAVF